MNAYLCQVRIFFCPMTYQETIDFLYQQLPAFQLIGKKAYKPGLDNTKALLEFLGNPHARLKTIHVAGTNGKGSSSHMLAAILQQAGYKTGLYTSPHLKDYTERVKINGQPIDQQRVIDFVERIRMFIHSVNPSFFEVSVALAFYEFELQNVDIAVIEVGMGGRLDSTNIITPELCLITNIGWDHADVLGDTLGKIAAEKGGIIKEHVPVVVSEHQAESDPVFKEIALTCQAPIYFAEDSYSIQDDELRKGKRHLSIQSDKEEWLLQLDLIGSYQRKNVLGVLKSIELLREMGYRIDDDALSNALSHVVELTGLKGRWQQLGPNLFCDTGHNEPGVKVVLETIHSYSYKKLWLILGFVKDKDLGKLLPLYPKDAHYVFCEASTPRALKATQLQEKAESYELHGKVIEDVNKAIENVTSQAEPDDLIVVGGSTFVVADIDRL
ncbi:MAG: folylpolyglutamate synthase/dihydrofolate synthase family protein [Siphonobacter sp.]